MRELDVTLTIEDNKIEYSTEKIVGILKDIIVIPESLSSISNFLITTDKGIQILKVGKINTKEEFRPLVQGCDLNSELLITGWKERILNDILNITANGTNTKQVRIILRWFEYGI